MSDVNEKDRWRELADLLGLPPDEEPKPMPMSPPPPVPPIIQQDAIEWQRPVHEAVVTPPEPIAEEIFEDVVFEETERSVPPFPIEEAAEIPNPEPMNRESDAGESQDRPRRSRRRGRRGQKGDPQEREPNAHAEPRLPLEETSEAREEPSAAENIEEEPREPRERKRDDRERGGRGRGRRPVEQPPPELDEEDTLEPEEELERTEPLPEEEDDEEIDKLTDWNVPSWNDLIGSLYRPER
jgi:hypothetical protein